MRITFVRHTSVDVEPHTCYGQTDVDLKESFTTEASIVKKNIEDMGVSFGKVFTSPLKRARLLADFCGYTDAVADHRLMEMNFGEWEMQKYDRIKDPRLQEWMNDWLHVRATGGERHGSDAACKGICGRLLGTWRRGNPRIHPRRSYGVCALHCRYLSTGEDV